jgi:murein DD-endopeptidase MepM/ murein hydrolase activator NlpD
MISGARACLVDLAASRPLRWLTFACLMAATAAVASPLAPTRLPKTDVAAAVDKLQADATAAQALRLVWEGADVDGDGRADFANPTGHAPREHDVYGEGRFGARRDGRERRHEGVDYVAEAGQEVIAPISGHVTKIGLAYAGDSTLKFVEITNPALRFAVRVFYVRPDVTEGEAVQVGRPIGTAKSLQRKYPGGMTDHVHLEVLDDRGRRMDSTRLITAQYAPVEAGSALTAMN